MLTGYDEHEVANSDLQENLACVDTRFHWPCLNLLEKITVKMHGYTLMRIKLSEKKTDEKIGFKSGNWIFIIMSSHFWVILVEYIF